MNGFSQEALDRASYELQRHFGREGSIYGIKACEEIARIALTAYGTVPEEGETDPLADHRAGISALQRDAARYRWLKKNCQYGFEDRDGPQLVHRNGETQGSTNPRWREELDAAIDSEMDSSYMNSCKG